MIFYRVKNMEPFKDGTILDGAFIKPGQFLLVSELEKSRMEQSGAVLEVVETLIKNPLKDIIKETVEEVAKEESPEPEVEVKPAPKKRGRPKKNA